MRRRRNVSDGLSLVSALFPNEARPEAPKGEVRGVINFSGGMFDSTALSKLARLKFLIG